MSAMLSQRGGNRGFTFSTAYPRLHEDTRSASVKPEKPRELKDVPCPLAEDFFKNKDRKKTKVNQYNFRDELKTSSSDHLQQIQEVVFKKDLTSTSLATLPALIDWVSETMQKREGGGDEVSAALDKGFSLRCRGMDHEVPEAITGKHLAYVARHTSSPLLLAVERRCLRALLARDNPDVLRTGPGYVDEVPTILPASKRRVVTEAVDKVTQLSSDAVLPLAASLSSFLAPAASCGPERPRKAKSYRHVDMAYRMWANKVSSSPSSSLDPTLESRSLLQQSEARAHSPCALDLSVAVKEEASAKVALQERLRMAAAGTLKRGWSAPSAPISSSPKKRRTELALSLRLATGAPVPDVLLAESVQINNPGLRERDLLPGMSRPTMPLVRLDNSSFMAQLIDIHNRMQ